MENSRRQQKHNHHGFIFFNSKPSNQTIPFNLSCTKSSSFDRLIPKVSFFPAFLNKSSKDAKVFKEELLDAIEPLNRGAEATLEDQQRVDELARKLEAVNPTKQPLKSNLLDGKWELIYTTSQSILQTQADHGTNCEEVISVEGSA